MTAHDWFRDNVSLYVADGLPADECRQIETHAAECAKCAQELAQWRLFDRGLRRLGAPVHFADDWEDRVVRKWHVTHRPPRRWSAPARWAAAVAAMVFIGALGAAVMTVAERGFLAFPGAETAQAGGFKLGADLYGGAVLVDGSGSMKSAADIQTSNSIDFFPPALALVTHAPSRVHTSVAGGIIGGKDKESVNGELDGLTANLQENLRGHSLAREMYENGRDEKTGKPLNLKFSPFGSINRNLGVNGIVSGVTPAGTLTPELNVSLKENQPPDGGTVSLGGLTMSDGVTKRLNDMQKTHGIQWMQGFTAGIELDGWGYPAFSPDGKQLAAGKDKQGKLWSTATGNAINNGRGPAEAKPDAELKQLLTDVKETHTGSLMFGMGVNSDAGVVGSIVLNEKNSVKEKETKATRNNEAKQLGGRRGFLDTDGTATGFVPPTFVGSGATAVDKAKAAGVRAKATEYYSLHVSELASVKLGGKSESIRVLGFQPALPTAKAGDQPAKGNAEAKSEKTDPSNISTTATKTPPVAADFGAIQKPEAGGVQPPKQPDPAAAQRKIIRTGEMEFEVDDFEASVVKINKLLDAIQGAFQATKNSDKLPNGKVRGAVVVRMPPEHLDKFTLELRLALAKTGELKTQRIGSQDVSKQYTDIESGLRAARTMEERFLDIIKKSAKGEVKDYIAAERELGIWRTKIEQMEGEIRYYNNQISLSTLTINLVEKEIRAAASMVVSEKVTMKIEADDVDKALKAALEAVKDVKGRVTKSDLKLHAAGQVEAILHFEVAPAVADAIKVKLQALGIVTHHDAQRTQTAEGGAAPMGETIKSRTNDVQFDVALYNVANIQPREALHMTIAVADVPGEYGRLLESVTQAKGQVRVSQLDEKDKSNLNATLEFDVPSDKRGTFDKQLLALGEVVSRNTTRAGAADTATDRKVGYRLVIKSVTSIPPRETFIVQAYSLDLPAIYKDLQKAVVQAQGNVRTGQLNEQDKNNVNAQFDFDVPTGKEASVDKLLEEFTDVHARTTNRLQPNEVATDRKVGYRITLNSRIPPRETVVLVLEVRDVEKVAGQLATSARSAKGKVTESKISQDAAGRAIATQHFEVPLAAKSELLKEIRQSGTVRGQDASQNLQAPESKLATAVIGVRLLNTTPILPSDERLWPQVLPSLSYAFRLFSVSLMFLLVGISVILPWVLVVWVSVKIVRRMRKGQATA